ncbi:hypothetical protein [Symbioplanes lichenis]|uniref:hypothetical protein n=1 Tax=Symbioplanes lichenis TaxID=1629072 RepID=UPI0027395853|nr:hypothetical protein [Actinoplanes lichenis]
MEGHRREAGAGEGEDGVAAGDRLGAAEGGLEDDVVGEQGRVGGWDETLQRRTLAIVRAGLSQDPRGDVAR